MSKEIPLTQGKVAIVDDEDFERVNAHKWMAAWRVRKWYAARNMPRGTPRRSVYLHRFIMGATKGQHCDHINGEGLDCRRSNLRFCTNSQNLCNRGKNRTNTSGYKGVIFYYWKKTKRPWHAQITVNGKNMSAGYYPTPEEAARGYDRAAIKYHGEFARLNFPQEPAQPPAAAQKAKAGK